MRRSRTSCDEDGESVPPPASPEKRRAEGGGFLSMLLITVAIFTLGVLFGSSMVNIGYMSYFMVTCYAVGECCTC